MTTESTKKQKRSPPEELPKEFEMVFQSWDTANKSSELSDYSVCTTWGVSKKHLYLLHVLRKRLDYPDLRRGGEAVGARTQSQKHPHRRQGFRDAADSGFNRRWRAKRDCYEPKMDKVMRMHSVSSTIENGLVHLPAQAPWLGEYVHELAIFNNGKYDDQCDSTSQALDWVKQGGAVIYGVLDYHRQLAAQQGARSNLGFSRKDILEGTLLPEFARFRRW